LIVDSYFALIEPRSYRKALTPIEAIDVIKQDANKKWNEELVKEFMTLVENTLK
jgi:HD-GYP domain-containing protein (c-di-GMP phosphodiesterase class II)